VRWTRNLRVAAVLTAGVLGLTACGGSSGQPAAQTKGGSPIVVASFNFTDSQILAELYANALEAKGYPVQRKLNLGSRELIYPSLKSGELQFIPEYQGAAITTGFGEAAAKDAAGEHDQLAKLFEQQYGVSLLNFAPAEDKNTYIVKADLAKEQGLTTISDLKKLNKVVLAGGPECEKRLPCFLGFKDVYKLNATFQTVQEAGPRVAQLKSGAVTVIPVDSVNPLVGDPAYVALKDDLGIVPTENVVPAVNKKVLGERGADFATLINGVSAKLTTEELRGLNKRVDSDGELPADVAKDWLKKQSLI
jgi:osmoprotectant transport system substrate-binding protein